MQNLIMMIVRGVAIGAIISAPMGPVGILCVQRTLDGGRRHGFYTGIGAAISDLIYCLLTGFGLSFIEEFLQENQQIIQILGSVVLIGFGVYIMRKNPVRSLSPPPSTAGRKGKDVLSGFLFTFSNPLILFLIIGLFARFNFQSPGYRWYHYVVGYISIVSGAIGWWWLVTFAVNKVRAHFNLRSMWIVNRVIGSIILIFALYGIVSAFIPDSKAEMRPADRILNHQVSCSSPEPLPAVILAPGPEAGRFSFIRLLPPDREVSGVELVLTNTRPSPTRSYEAVDAKGKRVKVKRPESALVMTDSHGTVWKVTMTSEESVGYSGDELGGETRLRLYCPDGKVRKLKSLPGFPEATPVHLDVRSDGADLRIGDSKLIEIPLAPPLAGFDLEVSPGGEMRVDEARIWMRSVPVVNEEIHRLDWGSPEASLASYEALTKGRSVPTVCGVWRLYSSKEDERLMRRGGEYRVVILPASASGTGQSPRRKQLREDRTTTGGADYVPKARPYESDTSYVPKARPYESDTSYVPKARPNDSWDDFDIWYLGGAETLAGEWPCGRLKGRLKATGYADDWELEWFDAEGHSCGPAARAHLSDGRLTLHFPRHGAELLFLR